MRRSEDEFSGFSSVEHSTGSSAFKIGLVVVLLAVAAFGLWYVLYPKLTKNRFVAMEMNIEELHKASLVDLSAMTGTIKLSGNAVKSKDEFMLEVIHEATEGRYGPDGAQQAILLLTENYPNMDTKLREQYIRGIEAGYAKFADTQRRLLQAVRIYKRVVHPDTWLTGDWVAKKYGFPRIDFADYEVILSKEAKEAKEKKEIDTNSFDPFAQENLPAEKEE